MVSVFNFDIYTIPEKFIEKSYLLSLIDNEEEVYVDDFISSFINIQEARKILLFI